MDQVTLVANITGNTRVEMLDGRKYLVAPLVMLIPGVLNGSQGALYYPPEEVSKNVNDWNGVPITVNHPVNNSNKQVSARNPKVISQQGIGTVFNSRTDGRLIAEGWFDYAKTEKVDETVLQNLEANQPMELSTGLAVVREPAEPNAEFQGVPYTGIARSYKPDHLAILTNQTGACSLEDGCGVLVNEETNLNHKELDMAKLAEKEKVTLVDSIVENCKCQDKDKEVLSTLSDETLQAMSRSNTDLVTANESNKKLDKIAKAALTGFEDPKGNTHSYNEETDGWETTEKQIENKKPAKTTKPKEDDPDSVVVTKEKWEEIQEVVGNARRVEEGAKRTIVDKLIFALDEGDGRTKLSKRLMSKSLVELEELQVLAPKQDEAPPVANYAGQAVGNTNDKFDKTDTLGLPVLNFSADD